MTKEELQKKAAEIYPIHEDDPQVIRNIREYEQNAYIKGCEDTLAENDFSHIDLESRAYTKGYEDAKKKLGWHKYPEEKPSEDGEYFVKIDSHASWYQASWWNEKEKAFAVWRNHITAWMPMPEEGGER